MMTKIREGYKETEIGVIPEEWEVSKLKDLSQIKRGASPRPISDKKWFSEDSEVGWIRISDVTSSKKYLLKTEQYLSLEGIKKSRPVKKGDLIMSICASIGVPIILNMDACIHDGFVVYGELDEKKIEKEYLYYFIEKMQSVFKGKGQTGTQANINTDLVGNTFIPLPPLPEQQCIAEILSTIDSHIEKLDKTIEDYQLLKKGMMKKLLTEGIGHTEFKETEIGRIPKAWEVKRANDIFNTVTDFVANGSFATLKENVKYLDDEDYAVLVRLTDFKNSYSGKFIYVDKESYNFLSKSKLEPNDIIIANVGANAGFVFRTIELNKPMTLGPNAILVRTNSNNEFIYQYLSSDIGQQQFSSIISTTAQPKFNKTDFKKILIALPPLPEQQRIAEILSTIDKKVETLQNQRQDLSQLKKSLMDKLLTGKVRVI